MTLLLFSGLVIACYGMSYMIMHQLARVSSRSYFLLRLMLLPGVIIHESAHAIACVLTGTPIVDISFWDAQGGHVTHHKPKYPFVLQPLISLAPLPIGILSLIWLSQQITPQNWWISAIVVFFMLSIAGTLAPSKTDFRVAAWGIAFLVVILGGLITFIPTLHTKLTSLLNPATNHLLLVSGILLTFWLLLILFERIMRRR